MTTPDPWTPSPAHRIDWPKVLDDIAYLLGDPLQANPILREAVSERELAQHLHVARSTIRGWVEGSEPRHADGEVLIAHWCRLTGKARTFIHIDRFVYSAAKVVATAPRATSSTEKPRAHAFAM